MQFELHASLAKRNGLSSRSNATSAIGLTLLLCAPAFAIGILLPALADIPIIYSCRGDFHCLENELAGERIVHGQDDLTVICSRKKSRSSSQFENDACAASSFSCSRASASGRGYESMTLAWPESVSFNAILQSETKSYFIDVHRAKGRLLRSVVSAPWRRECHSAQRMTLVARHLP